MPDHFANLQISKIIVHEIFRRDESKNLISPNFGNSLTNLDRRGLEELTSRINLALGRESYCLEMFITKDGPDSTFQIAAETICRSQNIFVNNSQKLTRKLAEAQLSRKIPGGIIVVFDGKIGNPAKKFIAVIKAELHSGFIKAKHQGTLAIDYVSDLLLTPQQKLYKIGILIENIEAPEISSDNYKVFIFDSNLTKIETRSAAQYFYEGFFGCNFTPTDKKLTQDFYNHTKEFILQCEMEEEEKVECLNSLYAYMKGSQYEIVQAHQFAEEFLDEEIRDDYKEYMQSNDFPETAINKDTTYIRRKIRRVNLKFSSDIQLTGPSEKFSDLVTFAGKEGTRTIVKIEGEVVGNN